MTTNNTETTATATAPQGAKPHRLIKLGVDVHWRQYVVVRQIDGASPQPPQHFTPDEFVAWAKKQSQLAEAVHCCYEAGPFGFVLHKRLVALGVKSLVVRPRNWDEYGKKVKTDRRDALALVSCLDRYLAGNKEALTVIRVPTDAEERARSDSRQRGQLLAERKRLAAQGLSNARYYGHDLPDEWWRPKVFAILRHDLPEFLVPLLERAQRVLAVVNAEFEALTAHVESAQATELPTGLGALTAQVLDREIGDWERFTNRRQVASYTGLVPSEDSSGERRFRGAITKQSARAPHPHRSELAPTAVPAQLSGRPAAARRHRRSEVQEQQGGEEEADGRSGSAVRRGLVAYPNRQDHPGEARTADELAGGVCAARQGARRRGAGRLTG